MQEKLIILGSGPAGLTAAIYAARARLNPLVIDGKQPGGQLIGTSLVENWPGEKSILGPQLMSNMREHATHFGARFLEEEVVSVNLDRKPFLLTTGSKKTISCEALIIATGANPRRLGCPGEQDYWGKGVTTCAICDGAFYGNRPVIIVGGGDTAMEDASFMTNFTDNITIVHVLDKLTASQAMQEKVIHNPAIKIIYEQTVSRVLGDGNHITAVEITHQKTGTVTPIPTDALFIAIGLTPNTHIFKDKLKLTSYGYIKVEQNTQTSCPGVFVAGDVADDRYRQAITSAGTGCMAALDAEKYLKKNSL